jgi:hypothetical protein
MNKQMLILPGIAGPVAGQYDKHGLLDRDSASQYARQLGYDPLVLNVSGEAYGDYGARPQVKAALSTLGDANNNIAALYGFSGGGYNMVHIWHLMSKEERAKIEQITIIGSPGVFEDSFADAPKMRVVDAVPGVEHLALPSFVTDHSDDKFSTVS